MVYEIDESMNSTESDVEMINSDDEVTNNLKHEDVDIYDKEEEEESYDNEPEDEEQEEEEDESYNERLTFKEGQLFIINDVIPENILFECFYFTIMMRNRDGLKFKSWFQPSKERKNLQLVCKSWCRIVKSSCKSLSLTKPNIKALTDNLLSFNNLKKMEILGGDYADQVSENFCRIIQLKHSTLEAIDLSMTDIDKGHLKLISQAIIASNNSIIKSLNFESNKLSDSGVEYLIESLPHLSSLNSIDLQCCESLNGLDYIGKFLRTNTSLRSLNWSYNPSDYTSVISLSDGLRENGSVEKLILRGCNIEGWGAYSISDTLRINKSIKYLDISENDFGDRGSNSISKNMNQSSLTYLDLSCNAMTSDGLNSILSALCTNLTITFLDISNNQIEPNSIIPMLSESLKSNNTIQTLKLSQSTLTDTHIEFISNGLLFNKSLTYLDISKNNFLSIIPFISIITNNMTLKTLNLSKNKIKENDLFTLIKYLLKLPYSDNNLIDGNITELRDQQQEEIKYNNIVKEVKHNLEFVNLVSALNINGNLKSRILKVLKFNPSKTKINFQ